MAVGTLIDEGQVIVGGCVSLIVTVKVQVALFGVGVAASLTVQVTVVVPFIKVAPLAGVQITAPTPEQLSLAVGVVYVTTAVHCPLAAGWVMLVGQVITGSVTSAIVTVNAHCAVLLEVSVAVQVTVVVPLLKLEPGAGLQATVAPGQLSVAGGVGKPITFVQAPAVVLVVILAGQLIVGACVSLTVTVKVVPATKD